MSSSRLRERRRPASCQGFTLIEILIVVVILGILAAIVVPQFSNASQTARENVLKDELRYLRMQIAVYAAQHQDVAPGYVDGNASGSASEQAFIEQMTRHTSESGDVSATSSLTHRFGPYLTRMPPNPFNGYPAIHVIQNGESMPIAAVSNATGWVYQPATMDIRANVEGLDSAGIPYYEY